MSPVESQHLFLHEMMHVYQHQRGMWVRTRGLFSWAAEYDYTLDKDQLSDYSMEQQACIVSDYWLLINHGFYRYDHLYRLRNYKPSYSEDALIQRYQHILRDFPA
ncbi:TPA: type IV secretion protein Rhs [Escherichia coli]|nr:type IV secretion protein Rhs [Escherichia coli]